MPRKKPITPFGWAIKRRLAELQMDQKEFCLRNNIPEYRLSNLVTGARKSEKYRKKVVCLLQLDAEEENG
ncbi:XRE family transcriptional regulator [Paenibacillus thermoaerophilus]|uniref:XRE family transcriptional regulator n=1 Tax=Paenibacillus thermoaerophilus TaxID=1215385 RepID=A0ABW2V8M1_9BACL|nr:XRE family transcriptional regulator [Paenibacillus thermoaerophilus]TMV17945.1 XRE family transcriptional regulator [Paenibacillus thermoaerophilus]